jgi:hypothetical protein
MTIQYHGAPPLNTTEGRYHEPDSATIIIVRGGISGIVASGVLEVVTHAQPGHLRPDLIKFVRPVGRKP